MLRIFQSFAILFIILIFYSNDILGVQPDTQVDPCDFMLHGRDTETYRNMYPIADFPFARPDLPVEFHLNYRLPEPYRQAAREAALEWRTRTGFRVITISDEIDYSEWNTPQQNQGSKNVIYWLNSDQYKNIDSKNESTIPSVGATAFQETSVEFPMPLVLVHDTDIFMDAERNTVMGDLRWMLTQHLDNMGMDYPKDMDTVELQHLFVERLSKINSEGFYNMVIKLTEDQEVTLPYGEPEDIQSWILDGINAERRDMPPLESFEDFRELIIREYTFDLTSMANSTVLFKGRLLHEIGHTLGLDHIDDPNSLMQESSTSLLPRFPRSLTVPKQIDDLTLYGLECSYNIERLRQFLPL